MNNKVYVLEDYGAVPGVFDKKGMEEYLKSCDTPPPFVAIYELNKEYNFGGNGRNKDYKFPEDVNVDKWWKELKEENSK
jgi:hypothetical protein